MSATPPSKLAAGARERAPDGPEVRARPPRRSVAPAPGAGDLVVKRIPARGARALHRASRARGEFELQTRLFAAGLAVPQPLELRDAPGALELVMRRVDGARTLARVLADGLGDAPTTRTALARAFGELVARAHSLGLDHGDLHEKNLLVDARGKPWIIDFDGSRLSGAPSARVARRDLATLAAATRERTSARERFVALCAWWRHVDARARPAASLRELAGELSALARERRRIVLVRSARRWLRASSAVRETVHEREPLLARVELSDDETRAIARGNAPTDAFGAVASVSGGLRALREAWCAAARLEEHAIEAARPLVFLAGRAPRAWFALPRGSRPLASAWASADPTTHPAERTRIARAFGAFHGALADRGLRIDPAALGTGRVELAVAPGGAVHVAAPFAVAFAQADAVAFRADARARLAGASESELLAALDAWREAARG